MEKNGSAAGAIDAGRLFVGSCVALIATATAFAVVGASMGAMKEHFVLSNEEIGWIGGAALWGFTISIFIFGPLWTRSACGSCCGWRLLDMSQGR